MLQNMTDFYYLPSIDSSVDLRFPLNKLILDAIYFTLIDDEGFILEFSYSFFQFYTFYTLIPYQYLKSNAVIFNDIFSTEMFIQ